MKPVSPQCSLRGSLFNHYMQQPPRNKQYLYGTAVGVRVMVTGCVYIGFLTAKIYPHPPHLLLAAFHYKQVIGLWHQGHDATFKPTT